jgi:hypothetical protein
VLELAVVRGLVVVALRLCDEPVVAKGPVLEPGDPNAVPGPAGPGGGADEGPVILDGVASDQEVVGDLVQA